MHHVHTIYSQLQHYGHSQVDILEPNLDQFPLFERYFHCVGMCVCGRVPYIMWGGGDYVATLHVCVGGSITLYVYITSHCIINKIFEKW